MYTNMAANQDNGVIVSNAQQQPITLARLTAYMRFTRLIHT